MEIPLSPSQDIGIKVKSVKATLAGLDDDTKEWTVDCQLELETPEWNKDAEGNTVDESVQIRGPLVTAFGNKGPRGPKMIEARLFISRADIATQAGLGAPEDVPTMPAGEMETAIIAVAKAKLQSVFTGLNLS